MQWAKDGGPNSTVDGFFVVEVKSLFTIVLLRFGPGTRDAYHSHAFNALTWWLEGCVVEREVGDEWVRQRVFVPSWIPKWTKKSCVHKVTSIGTTWALSFRGPWEKTWHELRGPALERVELGHGRVELR